MRPRPKRTTLPFAVNETLMQGLELNATITAAGPRFVRNAWAYFRSTTACLDVVCVLPRDRQFALELWEVVPAGRVGIPSGGAAGRSVGRVLFDDGA